MIYLLLSFLIIAVFFMAASECLRGVTNRDLELTIDESLYGAQSAKKIYAKADYYISACYVGLVLVLLVTGIRFGILLLSPALQFNFLTAAVVLDVSWEKFLWIILSIFLTVIILMVILQVIKATIREEPEKLLRYIAAPLIGFGWILFPLLFVIDLCQRVVLAILKLPLPRVGLDAASPEEISAIVERSSELGEIEEDQGEMIQGVIGLSDSVVREVMTPRKDIIAVSEKANLKEILGIFKREQLSRILVIGDTLDDVKGILIFKDLIPLLLEPKVQFDIRKYIRPVYTVSETMKTDDLLTQFQARATHFAVVTDEHGGVSGVVTVEDLVEEIVGEIFDEYDVPEEEQDVHVSANGDLLVDGGALIDDLNEEYDLNLPVGEYDTIAGLVMNLMGKIPDSGESVECQNLLIKVEKVSAHRLLSLRIIKKDL